MNTTASEITGTLPLSAHRVRHAGQERGPGHPVEERHAVEHHGRGEHAEQEVLHARLVALLVPLAPRGQHVGGDGEQLEGDEDADQVAAGGHHHHAQDRGQQQEVVLALVVVALLHVGGRQQDDDVPGQQEERLQHQREVVDHVAAAEHRAVRAVDGEREDRHQRGQQARARRWSRSPTSAARAGTGRPPAAPRWRPRGRSRARARGSRPPATATGRAGPAPSLPHSPYACRARSTAGLMTSNRKLG